ncbi:MAG: stalk domain-containing protein [Chthonomonadales bacterium]
MMRTTLIGRFGAATFLAASTLMMGTTAPAAAYGRREVLPVGTVIPVRLDTPLSSKHSRPGDRFRATVRYGQDDGGLPEGTRIEGVVREAWPSHDGKPGILDLDFRRIVFPRGEARALDASLISLDARSVKRSPSGRLIATVDRSKDRLKFVGIGAGAGLVIAALAKQNTIASVLLGAGAGYLYNELANKKPGDVVLKPGTEFGVRLDRQLVFYTDRPLPASYREAPVDRNSLDRPALPTDSKVRASDGSGDIGVLIDDRDVPFDAVKPFIRNGVVLVPLEPMAQAGYLDYSYDASTRVISVRRANLRLAVGSRVAIMGGRRYGVDAAPVVREGQVFVPMKFLGLALNASVYWDDPSRTVVITTREGAH